MVQLRIRPGGEPSESTICTHKLAVAGLSWGTIVMPLRCECGCAGGVVDDFGDTGPAMPTHYGVLIYLGDSAGLGALGSGPQISWIASGDESACWAAIEQWTATHRLRAGEHVEVLTRTGDPRRSFTDERDRIADERDRIADERDRIADQRDQIADQREDSADRREATEDKRERDLDRRRVELDELVHVVRKTSADVVASSFELLDDTQARLARTKEAVERSRDQVGRTLARARREQTVIDQQVASTRRERATRARAEQTPSAIADTEIPM